jgi:hypothetical protein
LLTLCFFSAAYCSSFSDDSPETAPPLLRCHRCASSAPETKEIEQKNCQNFTSFITYHSVESGVPLDVLLVAAMSLKRCNTSNFVCFHSKNTFTKKLNLLRTFYCDEFALNMPNFRHVEFCMKFAPDKENEVTKLGHLLNKNSNFRFQPLRPRKNKILHTKIESAELTKISSG